MKYWLVRTPHETDKINYITHNLWLNIENNKHYYNIKKGDILLLVDNLSIIAFGIYENKIANIIFRVKAWNHLDNIPYKDDKTTTIIEDKELLKTIKQFINIKEKSKKNLYISNIDINNFMSFNNKTIKFKKGINIFIGENGSGKSQILKLIYSIIESNNEIVLEQIKSKAQKNIIIAKSLIDIFRTKQLGNLVNKDNQESIVSLDLESYKIAFRFSNQSKKEVKEDLNSFTNNFISKKAIFIPAKEVLTFFKGFRRLYEKSYLEFDKTYYNLCKALEEPLSKESKLDDILLKIENILDGTIKIIDGNFYLIRDNREYEITLIAEGLRKIAMLAYLLSNSALDEQSILFWDEPEANMHPKLIDDIVSLLVILANKGIQIFISTHSPYILESFNNHLQRDKIKDINIDDKEIKNIEPLSYRKTTAYLLEENNIVNILDDELGLIDDKLLHNFNDINKIYDKMRDIEWDNEFDTDEWGNEFD